MYNWRKAFYAFAILVSSICIQVSAQKQANVWYFGNGIGLNFNSGVVRLTQNFPGQHANDVDEGHATVSDENGNFLFYTNGEQIWDKNAAGMQNGTGLLGHWSATQCATIFPVPGGTMASNLAKYVVLTTPVTSSSTTGIRYNIVDMNPATNGGYATGAVTSKNNVMPGAPTSTTEALASCPHWNGKDEWVVGHNETNVFYAWRVSADASGNIVVNAPVTSTIGDNVAGVAVMKLNNCFNKLAVATHNNSTLQVFTFNNQTGVVSAFDANPAGVNGVLRIDVSAMANGSTGAAQGNYGVEFSPNGKYLFVSQSGQNFSNVRSQRLYRYDLNPAATPTKANIEASRTTLLDRQGTEDAQRLGHLQLAPNGKIYMTHMYTFWAGNGALSVIDSPNDAAHGFSLESITWTGSRSSMGLPSFHKGFLAGSASISAADSTSGTAITDLGDICAGIATMFENKYTGTGTNYTWDVNAPNNTSPFYGTSPDGTKAYHRYTVPGDYVVVTTVTDAVCNYVVRDTAKITVVPVINTTGVPSCGTPNVTLTVTSTPTTGKHYVWYSDAALTTPIASGTPATVPAPLIGTVYVKEVETVTVTPTLVTPAIPAIPAGITSISTGPATGSYNWVDASSTAVTTNLSVTSAVTLRSFSFLVQGNDWNGGTATYGITIRDASNAVIGTYSVSGCVSKGGTACTGSPTGSVTTTGGTPVKQFSVVLGGGLALATGSYRVEIRRTAVAAGNATPSAGETSIHRNTTTLTNPSIAGFITNAGASPSGTFIHNISIGTPAVAAVPAVYKDVITSSNKSCSYSGAVVANCSLPVEFIRFNAQKSNEGALLSWSTAKEKDNNYFIVESSIDGITFTEKGRVEGAGTSSTVRNYLFTDNSPAMGVIYYRITQVDNDGTVSHTDVRHLKFDDELIPSLAVRPNPNNGQFILDISTNLKQPVSVEIFNTIGSSVWKETFESEGFISSLLDLQGLAKGVYFIKAAGMTQKLIIE